MIKIILCMLVGALCGWLLRRKRMPFLSFLIMAIVCLLLFVIGITIGEDKNAILQLGKLGIPTVVITIAATLGSIICAWLLWLVLRRNTQKKSGGLNKQ